MSGVLMTRKKLKEALESARAKRQKLSGLRITLLDATEMELSESYGSSLQDLVTSRLLSGKTSGILHRSLLYTLLQVRVNCLIWIWNHCQ